MSQTNMIGANSSGLDYRLKMNKNLEALASNSTGPTPPTTTFPNQWWFDTSVGLMMKRNSDDAKWEVFQIEQKPVSGRLLKIDVFPHPGLYTWGKPPGAKSFEVTVVGAGGGGGGGRGGIEGGGGGVEGNGGSPSSFGEGSSEVKAAAAGGGGGGGYVLDSQEVVGGQGGIGGQQKNSRGELFSGGAGGVDGRKSSDMSSTNAWTVRGTEGRGGGGSGGSGGNEKGGNASGGSGGCGLVVFKYLTSDVRPEEKICVGHGGAGGDPYKDGESGAEKGGNGKHGAVIIKSYS